MKHVASSVLSFVGARTSFLTLALTISTVGVHVGDTELIAQQPGTVTGVVLGTASQPLPAAQVSARGTGIGAVTDASGRFRLSGLTGPEVTLEIRRIGYRPTVQIVRVGATAALISLVEQTVSLDEVVVTGTPGGQARRELGNAITSINASEVTERGTVNNVQQLLNGRAPGVFVNAATGNVGSGARIRIRGAASMSLLNEPLIYVDGVRVNNQTGSGPTNQGFGSGSISRINDINPEDIESVEVIRGPAAATLYGTEASNGVIQILTKKGITGRPRWSLSTRQGANYVRDPEGRWPVNYNRVARVGAPGVFDTLAIDIIDREKEAGTPVFRRGRIQEYDISATGGSELFRYFASLGMEDTEGADRDNELQRYVSRLNLSLNPSSQFDIGLNLGYVDGLTQLPLEAGGGGLVWTTVLANPAKLFLPNGDPSWQRGFHSATPEQYSQLYHLQQRVDRFTGSLQFNHRPLSWLRHRLAAGTDRTRERNDELARRVDDPLIRATQGSTVLGYRYLVNRYVNYYTLDYSASAVARVLKELESTTSVGAQYYRNSTDFTEAYGEVFPTPGLTAINATTVNRSTAGDVFEDASLGFFVQEQLGWRDRLFLTAALRADDNSAFGQNFDRVYYPKYSLSWVISEEPFWPVPAISALKLRAAYGESGKQPVTFSALQTYGSVTGPGDVASVTPLFIGNADLGPERAKEVELGFDASGFNDRLGLEFTYYNKKTTDAILDRQIPPSLGVPGTQPFNAGAVRNWGTEWLLRATPLARRAFGWDFTFSFATNDSEVLDLGTPEAILRQRCATAKLEFPCDVPDAVSGGSFIRHQVGSPVGSYFEKRVVSAAFRADGRTIDPASVMCDDGKGGTLACGSAPQVFLGRSLPDVEGAIGNTITLGRNFRIYSLFDFKRGYRKVNGNTRVRCTFFDQICRENFYPQEFDPVRIAGVQSGRSLFDFFIEDASYTKFRELSFSFILPERLVRRANFSRAVVSLAGRNLYTWTNYTGLEPEAFFLGGTRGGNFGQWEQTTMPQLTQWVLSFNVDW